MELVEGGKVEPDFSQKELSPVQGPMPALLEFNIRLHLVADRFPR